MENYDVKFVEKITHLQINKRKELLNYYASMPEQVKLEAHRLQTDFIRQNRHTKIAGKNPEYVYANLLLALNRLKFIEHEQATRRNISLEDAEQATHIKIERIKAAAKRKESPLRDLIELKFFELIKQLRAAGLSWRKVENYISKNHKTHISHAYLHSVYNQIWSERVGTQGEIDDEKS